MEDMRKAGRTGQAIRGLSEKIREQFRMTDLIIDGEHVDDPTAVHAHVKREFQPWFARPGDDATGSITEEGASPESLLAPLEDFIKTYSEYNIPPTILTILHSGEA